MGLLLTPRKEPGAPGQSHRFQVPSGHLPLGQGGRFDGSESGPADPADPADPCCGPRRACCDTQHPWDLVSLSQAGSSPSAEQKTRHALRALGKGLVSNVQFKKIRRESRENPEDAKILSISFGTEAYR